MRANSLFYPLLLFFSQILFFAVPVTSSQAALYWQAGVRDNAISLCFAGNAVTQRPDRVLEIVGHLQEFEYAANIRFMTLSWTRATNLLTGGNIQDLACPAPLTLHDGTNYYNGDIRVALLGTNVIVSGTGLVAGTGCTQDLVDSSWSNPPSDLPLKRACQYNLKLGDDDLDMTGGQPGIHTGTPWLNHTLHEFGHALGLAHDHARVDENAQCVLTTHDEYHLVSSGYITPYDKDSVMHYRFWPSETPNCEQTGSNYSAAGLTAYDKLALHILYPENERVAEIVGRTVIRENEVLFLQSAWKTRGANMDFVASNFVWKLNGVQLSSTPGLAVQLGSAGEYQLTVQHKDFLGRSYSYNGIVRVVSDEEYKRMAVAATTSFFFTTEKQFTLQDAVVALQIVAGLHPSSTILPEVDADSNNKIGLAEAVFILGKLAEQ